MKNPLVSLVLFANKLIIALAVAVALVISFWGVVNVHAASAEALQQLESLPPNPAYSSGDKLRREVADFKARKPTLRHFRCEGPAGGHVQYEVYAYAYQTQAGAIPALYFEYTFAPGVTLYVDMAQLAPNKVAVVGTYALSDRLARAIMSEPFMNWLSLHAPHFFKFLNGELNCEILQEPAPVRRYTI